MEHPFKMDDLGGALFLETRTSQSFQLNPIWATAEFLGQG